MSEKKLLSVCMITKNDESVMEESLQKTKEIADEIIIADIESNDRTVEIAEREGATVYSVKWENDFGKVKNFCIDHARGRWVLFLQPNEIFAAERKEILPLLDNPNVEGYLLFVDYCSEEFRIASPVQYLRLIRNHPENRFRYRSFECLPFMDNIKDAKLQIKYRTDAMQTWELPSRIALLWEESGQYPTDGYLQYLVGMALLDRNGWQEGIAYLEAARKNCNPGLLFAPHLYKCLSFAYLYLEQYDEAMEVLREGVDRFSFYSDLLVLRAELYKQTRSYDDAIRDLESCLTLREQPNLTVPEPEIDNAVVFETLGEIYGLMFYFKLALTCYRQALELDTENVELIGKIVEMAVKTKSCDVLPELLTEGLQEGTGYMTALAEALLAQREYAFLLDNWDCIASVFKENDNAMRIRPVCRMILGMEDYLDNESPLYFDVLRQRIEICWSEGEWMEAEGLLVKMENIPGTGPLAGFYRFIHGLLMGMEYDGEILAEPEYELAAALHDDFLWREKEDAAMLLLPCLMRVAGDENCIRLAGNWAERGNLAAIEMIFPHVLDSDNKAVFIQTAIEILLRYGHVNVAHKLADLGGTQPLGELEHVLWSRHLTLALEDWAKRAADAEHVAVVSPAPVFGDTQLFAFYKALCRAGRKRDESSGADCLEELTAGGILEKTGDIYLEAGKPKEALFAYLKGLQWEPQNETLLEKMLDLFYNDSEFVSVLLEKKEWSLEGGWFGQKQAFVDFIHGMGFFFNGRIEEAVVAFSQITGENEAYSLSRAYIAAGLLICGRQREIKDEAARLAATVCRIGRQYVLYQLEKISRQYTCCELIAIERDRVKELQGMR